MNVTGFELLEFPNPRGIDFLLIDWDIFLLFLLSTAQL